MHHKIHLSSCALILYYDNTGHNKVLPKLDRFWVCIYKLKAYLTTLIIDHYQITHSLVSFGSKNGNISMLSSYYKALTYYYKLH